MECDRYRVADRTAAALASALLRDLELKGDDGKNDVIDKNKVKRERENLQKELLKQSRIVSNPKAIAFDGKKDIPLTHTKTPDGRLYPRRVLESHITVLRQPFSVFLGYVTAPEIASAPEIAEILLEYFKQKSINLSNLIGVCCDGEPKNTGRYTGILRSMENQLGKPLHWFVCSLHSNESVFRHFFEKVDGSRTTGPTTSTGVIARAIENVAEPVRRCN